MISRKTKHLNTNFVSTGIPFYQPTLGDPSQISALEGFYSDLAAGPPLPPPSQDNAIVDIRKVGRV